MGVTGVSLEQLRSASLKTVGTKETMKAVQSGRAKKVFVAEDAEVHVTRPLRQLCQQRDVLVVYVSSMRELGKFCGIEVGAASAAIVEE